MRVTVNGVGTSYLLDGPADAPVITFSHALAASSAMWSAQAAASSARYRVLRYDIRGHGESETTPGPYTLEQLADDVYALLGTLGIERTHFVGLSMGGMIAQHLALAHPEALSSLVLCDTAPRMPPEGRLMWDERINETEEGGMEPSVTSAPLRWFTAPFLERHPEVVERVQAMIATTDARGFINCARAIQEMDLLDRLPEIRVPTLVIVGDQDPGSPVFVAEAIRKRIPGAKLVVLEPASHLSNLEQPEAFNQALSDFLSEVERGG
jgi:3-oxoadipate enol-lactonase